jgi:hypothetical protein
MRCDGEGGGGVVGNGRQDGLAGRTREGRGGNCRALSSRDGTGVGVSIRCRDTRMAGPGPGPGRLSPGLSGIADLCGPRLEGLGPDGEPQVSGESPLAVTSVPPLPCPIACSSGSGRVHRRLLSSIQYTTGKGVCFARPGISRLFLAGSLNNPGPASFDPALAAPLRAARVIALLRYIALSR